MNIDHRRRTPWRTAIITGASSGIGAALARELAASGCKVGLTARRENLLLQLAQEIRDSGGIAEYVAADVTDRHSVVAAIHAQRERLGPTDLLIANAGVGMSTRIEPPNTDEVETMIRVNLFGVIYAIEAVLPEMLGRKQGHIAA